MARPDRLRQASGKMVGVLLAGAALLPGQSLASPVQDSTAAGPAIPAPKPSGIRAVPAGFEDLDRTQSAVVDVIFGGRVVGTAQVTFTGSTFSFDAPEQVLPLLPPLTSPAAIQAELGRPDLSVNARHLCRTGADQTTCERLTPTVAGFILDRDRFRVLVFINPEHLALQSNVPSAYLPSPEPGAGLLSTMSAVISGSAGQDPLINLENQLVVAAGVHRLRAELGYATGLGLRIDTLRAELDRPGWRYSAGALWSRPSSFIARRQLLGVEVASQTDTRMDKDNLKGSPLTIFLEQRSRVEIMRDGRILAARIYEAGNQLLDTSTLPEGVYEVTLRVLGINGAVREERKFFSKNAYMPAPGQTLFQAAAGLLVAERRSALPKPTGTPFAQAGWARRIADNLALDASAMATNRAGVIELGSTFQTTTLQLRAAAMLSSRGERAVLAQLSSHGTGPLNFSFDLRRVTNESGGLGAAETPNAAALAPLPGAELRAAPRSFTQLTGQVSYSLARAQLQANGYYRRERGQAADYSIGPSLRMTVLERSAWQVTVHADAAFSSRGQSGYLGLSLQLLRPRSTVSARAGSRLAADTGGARRSAAVGALSGAISRTTQAGELELVGGYERDIDRDLVNVAGQLRGERGTIGAQLSKGVGGQPTPLQYSLGLQTTLAARGGALGLTGTRRGEGAVLLKVDSDQPGARFEVLVNEAVSGELVAGEKLALTLPSYRTYTVRIRPTGSQIMQVDTSARTVSLYPGSVVNFDWQARRQLPVFGKLVLANGQPVRFAAIRAENSAAMTDGAGFFQFETSANAVLEANLPGAGRCYATIPALPSAARYAKLGDIECRPAAAPALLSSRN